MTKNPFKKLSRKKKVLFVIAVIFLFCFLVGLLFPKSQKDPGGPLFSAGKIERSSVSETIAVKSTVEGSDSANVYSGANYRIASVTVKEGDSVQEGQILAALDADDLKDEYRKAQISYNEAKRNYDNTRLLYEEGASPKTDYLAAKAAYDTARLTLDSINLTENANVTSPISGTVTRVNATVGKMANGGNSGSSEPLFVIENIDKLQMKVRISEYDIRRIRVGQTAEITAEVLGGQTLSGVVSHISPTGEPRDSGSTEMVIPVLIDIDKGDSSLIAGVTAKATILIASAEDVLTVPIDAILEDPETGDCFIFLLNEENTLSKIAVKTGIEGDLRTEITPLDEGASAKKVAEGARVLLSPTYDCQDGMSVTIQ